MFEDSLAGILLFLLLFTGSVTYMMFLIQGSVNANCEFNFNATINNQSSNSDFLDIQNQLNNCKNTGFPDIIYILFLTPMAFVIALCIKKLAFI